jgi:hypothetical protein
MPKTSITTPAEQSSNFAADVVVVDGEPLTRAARKLADATHAFLLFQQCVVG